MAEKSQDALAGLDHLIADARARLAANPDYIALKAFEKARAEIVGVRATQVTAIVDEVMQELVTQPYKKRVSQLTGAEMTLDKIGHPLPVKELMDGAIEAGAVIGGDNPQTSFGSSLSKSDKFKSVRWAGEYAWWFSDRPLPERARIRPMREAAE